MKEDTAENYRKYVKRTGDKALSSGRVGPAIKGVGKKDESESMKYIIKNGKKGDYHPKIKSEEKPMEFYKQKGKEGKVHVGAMKEKK